MPHPLCCLFIFFSKISTQRSGYCKGFITSKLFVLSVIDVVVTACPWQFYFCNGMCTFSVVLTWTWWCCDGGLLWPSVRRLHNDKYADYTYVTSLLQAVYVTSAAQTQPRIVDVGTGCSSDGLSNCIRHFAFIKIYNVNFQTHENSFLLFLSFFLFSVGLMSENVLGKQ